MSEQKWNKIGDVVGAAGGSEATSGKKLYQVRLRGAVLYREGIYIHHLIIKTCVKFKFLTIISEIIALSFSSFVSVFCPVNVRFCKLNFLYL